MMLKMIVLYFALQPCYGFIHSKINKRQNLSARFVTSPSKVIQDLGFGSKLGNTWGYSELINNAKHKAIDSATLIINQNDIVGIYSIDNHIVNSNIDSENIHATKLIPALTDGVIKALNDANVNYDILDVTRQGFLDNVPTFFQLAGLYIIVGIAINTAIRFIGGGGNMGPPGRNFMNPLSMMQSNNAEVNPLDLNVTFKDVAGCEEAKFELMEVVDFLKKPEKYTAAGAKIPKGVLLEGPPGTGKTLLARAVAGESGVPFFQASGSQFIEMFVGVGASRVRDLFNKASENSPCVVFIDEIDAVGRQRGTGFAGGNDEREQTLNQILTNMDGFSQEKGVIVLAATNRADILDAALVRPGRFDRKVNVGLPDQSGRREIMDVHFKNKNINDTAYLDVLSKLTQGFSGADISNLANEAAILSVRNNDTLVTNDCIYKAYEKMTIGLPTNVETRPREILELVSYHEIGHTIPALLFSDMFDVQKVTIRANKNGAGGYTLFTPKDKFANFPTKKFMLANMIIALGGRAAEVVYCNSFNEIPNNYKNDKLFQNINNLDITTGASNDLKQANSIARKYVSLFGLGNQIGLYDNSDNSQPFLGRDIAMGGNKLSEYSKNEIDIEIKQLVEFAYDSALNIIHKNNQTFYRMAYDLLHETTLNYEELITYDITYK